MLAAIIAFKLAQPYESTLAWPGLSRDDPRTLFTYGTKWGAVNRIAFGALICGSFSVALSLGRRSVPRVAFAGVLGAAIGGLFNFVTDSSADLIGLAASSQSVEFGSLLAMLSWCILVPIGIAFAITLALGLTAERVKRAMFAVKWAAVASFCVQMIGGMAASVDAPSESAMQAQVPVWRLVEIAVGIAFGITVLIADEWVRAATIRLMHGKNEYRDWSIDNVVTRIGSAEGCEIPLFGFQGIEPVHLVVVRQGNQFIIEAKDSTLLNGQPVTQATLNSGDTISVGNAQLVFTLGASAYRLTRPQGYFQPVQQIYPAQTPYPTYSVQPAQPIQSGYPTYPNQPGQVAPSGYPTYPNQPAQPSYPAYISQPVQPVPQAQPVQPLYVSSRLPSKILMDAYGQQVPLPPGRYGVGRENTNAFCLYNDPYISPHHAEFVATDVGLEVVDLGCATGTRVNGLRITGQAQLKLGDVIEFGSSRFTYCQ